MSRSLPLRLAISALAIAAVLACGEHASPTSPASSLAVASHQPPPPKGKKVAQCFIPHDYTASARIGAKGGKLSLGQGNALVFPPGALSQDTQITAFVPAGNQARVRFSPEGLTFPVPAVLTLNYSACITPTYGVTVVYLQADTVTEVEPSVNDPKSKSVTATIGHFSSYAVAY